MGGGGEAPCPNKTILQFSERSSVYVSAFAYLGRRVAPPGGNKMKACNYGPLYERRRRRGRTNLAGGATQNTISPRPTERASRFNDAGDQFLVSVCSCPLIKLSSYFFRTEKGLRLLLYPATVLRWLLFFQVCRWFCGEEPHRAASSVPLFFRSLRTSCTTVRMKHIFFCFSPPSLMKREYFRPGRTRERERG